VYWVSDDHRVDSGCGEKDEEIFVKSAIGQNVHRIDGEEKVRGKAVYTGDLKLPGMLYGKVLRSPLPHARIRGIDCKEAESLPGVVAVLTRDNLRVPFPYFGAYYFMKDQPVLALEKVRYAGDIVAAIAATEDHIAEEALQKIHVDYEELPSVVSLEDALKDGAPLIHENAAERRNVPQYGRGATYIEHKDSNIFHHFRFEQGNTAEGFGAAERVFEDTFFFPGAQHYSMEPHIGIASFEHDHVTVWCGVQVPFPLRDEVASIFDIPTDRVRIIVPYQGGGYGGGKGVIPSVLAAVLSHMTHRPVQVAFSVDESFKTICQPRAKLVIKTGLNSDGTFLARQCAVYLIAGAYAHFSRTKADKMGLLARGPYRISHVLTDSYAVYTNTVPATAFRGFGGPHVAFAYESHLDMIAHRLKMDPVELRMKNLLQKTDEYNPGDTPINCDLREALRQVASSLDSEKRDESEKRPWIKRGKGFACTVKDGGATPKGAHATVKILRDGSVLLSCASVEIGQGVRTSLLQIVAEELAINPDQVQVEGIDTDHTPFDGGTTAHRGIAIMGQAVQQAALDAREKLLLVAASAIGCERSQVKIENGIVVAEAARLSFREVLQKYFSGNPGDIVGSGACTIPITEEAPLRYRTPFWGVGVGGVEVEVDAMLGQVKILRFVSFGDAGKMINPLMCRGQEEGSVLFGIGHTFFEELIYEDGQLINPNLVDYRLPKFRDLPPYFISIIAENGGGPGPYGSKGLGEAGTLSVAAAVCNALYDAIGVRIQELPLRGERVWDSIRKLRHSTGV
jgi:CO/xanthine dehydrogenase Mo-binding subunit